MNKRVNTNFLPRQARPIKRLSLGPGQQTFNTIVASDFKEHDSCLGRCHADYEVCEFVCDELYLRDKDKYRY